MIERLIATGRLHPPWRGVYAVGRPEGTRKGRWMAAVLTCGPRAVLSHSSAAALWGIGEVERGNDTEVSVPASLRRRRPGIVVHRRAGLPRADLMRYDDTRAQVRFEPDHVYRVLLAVGERLRRSPS